MPAVFSQFLVRESFVKAQAKVPRVVARFCGDENDTAGMAIVRRIVSVTIMRAVVVARGSGVRK